MDTVAEHVSHVKRDWLREEVFRKFAPLSSYYIFFMSRRFLSLF